MLTRDRVGGIELFFFAVAVMWEDRVFPLGTLHKPGPGYMPMLLAAILAGMLPGVGPLAGWGDKRLAVLPELPTLKELGYDAEFYIWAGLFAPRGMPERIMKKLRDTVRAAVQDVDFKSAMDKLETPIAYLDAPEFQKFWDKDAKMLADAIKRVGRIEETK